MPDVNNNPTGKMQVSNSNIEKNELHLRSLWPNQWFTAAL